MAGVLEGQAAFVTGGGSGLGESIARRLAADGATVAVNDLDGSAAERVAAEIGGRSFVFDVCDPAAFDAAVDSFASGAGRLDIVVNNAGIAPRDVASKIERQAANAMRRMTGDVSGWEPMNHVVDLTDDDWDRMIRVHLYGAFHGCRAALRHMTPRRSGRIVNMSSVLGLRPAAGAPHYSAAKAAIIALTKSVADEVAPLGINVNAVCPGYIDTPLLDPFGDQMKAGIVTRIGKGRMGTPADIAEMVRFLCGPESEYCTAEVYPVTGGYSG